MKSPCIQVCKIEKGVCLGCHRTLNQIKDWTTYTDRQRENIMEDIKRAAKVDHQHPMA